MAQPSNTFSSYDSIGNKEDLKDIIYNVAPWETPLLSAMPNNSASGTLHEWQTDSLASASQNWVIEGDDATTDASVATVRLTNHCGISDKVARVTGTQEAVDKAGRGAEMSYQLVKRGRELKNDIELSIFANNAKVAGNDTTAREVGGLEAWIDTATSAGSGGSDGSLGSTARTDGTQRAFTETLLLDVHQTGWTNGMKGNSTLYVGAYNKRVASGFTGPNVTKQKDVDDKRIISTADIYMSDFGELTIVASRNCRARTAYLVDHDMLGFSTLRNMVTTDLAKTGDSDQKQILTEWTIEVRNEKAHGLVADLTTS
jgi:hypothetical protein